MQSFGQTRSSYRSDHLLLTPDSSVRTILPGMEKAKAVVHVSPARGARFTQYTAEFEAGGMLGPTAAQRFVYVLEGRVHVADRVLGPNDYGYLPEGYDAWVTAPTGGRAVVIEKPYRRLEGVYPPAMHIGFATDTEAKPLGGDTDMVARHLMPDQPAFDFAMNVLTYRPGASLPKVETHVMEHGLLVLEGGGIFRLGERWYSVTANDFIWTAPWCPHWFGALGKVPASYLVYKEWNR